MGIGKLYKPNNEFIVDVSYHFHDDSETSWWGELVPTEYKRLNDDDVYLIELEDGRKGKCAIRKNVNKAVIGVPPLYYYHFKGRSQLK